MSIDAYKPIEGEVPRSVPRPHPRVRPEVHEHYRTQASESTRLRSGRAAIEFDRQKEILTRVLPKPPGRILDIGGGPGSYSLWLAGRGYEVHLLDPVELHVQQAARRASRAGLEIDTRIGDARSLPYPSKFADAVLLMGPLYHLVRAPDRRRALREALRVLRPGGVLAAVGISRFTSLLDGSWQGYIRDPAFRRIVRRDLRSGQHRNPKRVPAYFTTAFFAHPDELRAEAVESGFSSTELIGSEGFLWWVPDILRYWQNARLRSFLLETTRKIEREPMFVGLGPHFMVIGRRPR